MPVDFIADVFSQIQHNIWSCLLFIFQLKPYVSYRVGEDLQTQPKHTAEELFKQMYKRSIEKKQAQETW